MKKKTFFVEIIEENELCRYLFRFYFYLKQINTMENMQENSLCQKSI